MVTVRSLLLVLIFWNCLAKPVQVTINNHNIMHASQMMTPQQTSIPAAEQRSVMGQIRFSPSLFISSVLSLAGCYCGYELWQLYKTRSLFNDMARWCSWQKEIPLAALAALPRQEVLSKLATDIKERYPQDTGAWYCFMRDLDNEHTQLTHGIWLLETIANTGVVSLLFDAAETIEAYTNALKRIEYLQTLLEHGVIHANS